MTVLDFIVSNLPMLICFVAGIVCLVLEAFMPGFGLPGVSGIFMEVVAVVLCWSNVSKAAALGMTLIILSLVAIAVSMSLRSAAKGRLSKSAMILKHTESAEEGYRSSDDMNSFLGMEGIATTVLRPTGMAEFDDVKLNVVSDGAYIQPGSKVRIVRVEGSKILVRSV